MNNKQTINNKHRKSLFYQAFIMIDIYFVMDSYGRLLADTKRRKNTCQHIFCRRFAGDLSEVTKCIV